MSNQFIDFEDIEDRDCALEDFQLLQCALVAHCQLQWNVFFILALPLFYRYLRLYSECPGLYPENYGHNLTVQDNSYACSVLQYDIRAAGTYWIAVEGVDNQEGTFEVSLTCSNGTVFFFLNYLLVQGFHFVSKPSLTFSSFAFCAVFVFISFLPRQCPRLSLLRGPRWLLS